MTINNIVPLSLVMALLLALPAGAAAAGPHPDRATRPAAKNPPFLITARLPHLTLLLKQHWNNPQLALTGQQKKQLLRIRRETIGAVTKIKGEIAPLEDRVIQGIRTGKTPEELRPLVRSIADLKTRATMIHLACIEKTRAILNRDQLAFLRQTAAR